MANDKPKLSYKDAGVDIEAGNRLVEQIKSITQATRRPEVLTGIGGFGGLFALPLEKYRRPVLVSGTDGVGTKLKLAQMLAKHDTIGIDLVAMCVNDIIVSGAEPLFFLDYFATAKLDPEQASQVVKGIGAGCEQAGCALVGGETAEMPGMYHPQDYDLAGFCVGIVEQDKIIDGTAIKANNVLLGLASSGPHSNGYSLIRKILELNQADLSASFGHSTLGETLLMPTKIYVKSLLTIFNNYSILGLAHITGGGLLENLPRILPTKTKAVIHKKQWQWPEIFQWLQKLGNVSEVEMYRTFNCGIGMVLCVEEADALAIQQQLTSLGETCWQIGYIESAAETEAQVELC